jgi:hypothetical protein
MQSVEFTPSSPPLIEFPTETLSIFDFLFFSPQINCYIPYLALSIQFLLSVSIQLNSGTGRSSLPPTSIREKIQQRQAEGAAETTMIIPKGGPDPEKPVHTHDDVQEEGLRSTASRTAPALLEIAAFPTSPDDFGTEDDEYLSGYKLSAALFGIISIFFIVLLDLSIISTVSMNSPQNHCVPRDVYRCPR